MTDRPSRLGPRDRIAQLYDRHAAALYRYALMILANHAAASDAVQQVFVRIVERLEDRSTSAERGPWPVADEAVAVYLKRAVRNECFTQLRRSRLVVFDAVDAVMLEEVAGTNADPDDRLIVEQALRTLPAEQREVVHLKVFEGMTFQQIADLTDESINTVASRYRYAIEKLEKQLS